MGCLSVLASARMPLTAVLLVVLAGVPLLAQAHAFSACDASAALAAAHARHLGGKFSQTARLCADEAVVAEAATQPRHVAPVEDHAEHLLMYDVVDVVLETDLPLAQADLSVPALRGERQALQAAPAIGLAPLPASPGGLGVSGRKPGPRAMALMPHFQSVAQAFGLDHLLLHAIAHVESRHNPLAVSPAGAIGLMQVMPATARRFGVTKPHVELRDPQVSLRVSAAYLHTLRERFGNNLTLMLAAYNAGEGAVEKYGRRIPPYPETRGYVTSVLATYRQLRAAASPDRMVAQLFRGDKASP